MQRLGHDRHGVAAAAEESLKEKRVSSSEAESGPFGMSGSAGSTGDNAFASGFKSPSRDDAFASGFRKKVPAPVGGGAAAPSFLKDAVKGSSPSGQSGRATRLSEEVYQCTPSGIADGDEGMGCCRGGAAIEPLGAGAGCGLLGEGRWRSAGLDEGGSCCWDSHAGSAAPTVDGVPGKVHDCEEKS